MKTAQTLVIVAILALALLVSGAGCKRETTANQDAQQLDQEISGFENTSQAVDDLGLEFNDSDLEDIEGMF